MSYVGKMSDLIELYLAELERDGICYLTVTNELNGSCAISTAQAKELLTDFAQWLEDDVQDDETVDGLSVDTVLIDNAAELNLTGFGDIVEDFLTDEEGAGFLEIMPKPGFYKCLKTVIMNEGFEEEFQHQAFTAGKFYGGRLGSTPGGDYTIIFKDDAGMNHHAHGAWLYEHFEFAAEYNPD